MDLFEVGRAAQTTINQRLIGAPVQINDRRWYLVKNRDGNNYQVTGLRDGVFTVTALGPSGEPLQGGQTELPCNENYLGLVLDQWISTGTNRTKTAGAAGGGQGSAHQAGGQTGSTANRPD